MKYDVIILGAGMVGVSCALHVQRKGRSVAMLDRRAPGLETSFGNAGLIQREAEPYALPRDPGFLLCGALNQRTDVRYHPLAVLHQAGPLFSYFQHSAPATYRKIAREYETLIAHCLDTHAELMEAAHAQHLVAPTRGFLTAFRTTRELHKGFQRADRRIQDGVQHVKLDATQLARMEPALQDAFVGAVQWTDPMAILNPGELVQAYARLFERQGGTVLLGDAMTLARHADGWQVHTTDGTTVTGADVVIALGPWTPNLTAKFGYKPPMFIKRGYHMHYARLPDRPLNHWIMDAEKGYVVCPMQEGIRLTTGAELADVDAPHTPGQLRAAEAIARAVFPLGARLNPRPWVGARPCMPDMKPVFGAVPGHTQLWCAFGHAHQGFTLGPITGELLAAHMTGAKPRVDITPFSPARF